jgi:hypothetical protein
MTDSPLDDGALRAELREYHNELINAHIHKRPGFFVENIADDYLNVSRGEVLHQTKTEILEAFADYLANTEFSEYRLVDEPIIGLSKEGSMAWSIFRLRVAGVSRLEDGSEAAFDSTWGCLVLFERRENRWVRLAEISNRRPSES